MPQEIPFDPRPLLHLLTDGYTPAPDAPTADREVSSSELQRSIFDHTGEEVPLSLINAYMKDAGYLPRATDSMEILWMMQYRQS